LSYLANTQTNGQTNTGKNITSLAEVTNVWLKAKETDISAALRQVWLAKDYVFYRVGHRKALLSTPSI